MRSSSPTAAPRTARPSWPPRAARAWSAPGARARPAARRGVAAARATGCSWSTRTPGSGPRRSRRPRRRSPGPEVQAAAWPLAIDGRDAWLRWVERGAALRWRLTGLAYGDQGLLVRRSLYEAAGGYPETPHHGGRRADPADRAGSRGSSGCPAPILADARRWRREGRVRGTLRNAACSRCFSPASRPTGWPAGTGRSPAPDEARARGLPQGAPPRHGEDPARRGDRRAAGAPALPRHGEPHARRRARRRASRPRSGSRRPMRRAEMRLWLGEQWDLRPQASGDLGARLAAAAQAVERGRGWLAHRRRLPAARRRAAAGGGRDRRAGRGGAGSHARTADTI